MPGQRFDKETCIKRRRRAVELIAAGLKNPEINARLITEFGRPLHFHTLRKLRDGTLDAGPTPGPVTPQGEIGAKCAGLMRRLAIELQKEGVAKATISSDGEVSLVYLPSEKTFRLGQ